MDVKLTLLLNRQIIADAKKYAKSQNTSVSRLVEKFLATVSANDSDPSDEISPLVRSIYGVVKPIPPAKKSKNPAS